MDSSMIVSLDAGVRASELRAAELARLRARVRELASELVVACEAARVHLARELHDGVGAELTAARFALAGLQPSVAAAANAGAHNAFDVAQTSLEAACETTHRVVSELHAPHFDGGVLSALSQWTRAFTERTGLRTSFVCSADLRLTQVSQGAALAIFRVAQEALSNVAKHAGAACVDVRIQTDARYLTLIVRDDGRGMRRRHRAAADALSVGFGLAGMRARCEAFDGSLRIVAHRADAAGTTVRARFGWSAILDLYGAATSAASGTRGATAVN